MRRLAHGRVHRAVTLRVQKCRAEDWLAIEEYVRSAGFNTAKTNSIGDDVVAGG